MTATTKGTEGRPKKVEEDTKLPDGVQKWEVKGTKTTWKVEADSQTYSHDTETGKFSVEDGPVESAIGDVAYEGPNQIIKDQYEETKKAVEEAAGIDGAGTEPGETQEAEKPGMDDQCFLMQNLTSIISDSIPGQASFYAGTGTRYESRKDIRYKNIHKVVTKDPALLMNKLRMTRGADELLNIKPWEFSQLTPTIRLYKEYYEDPQAVAKEVEFKFNSFVDPVNDLQSMLDSTLQRGVGVGIESFSYRFRGVQPATAKKDIEATVVIYAQNFNELFKKRFSIDKDSGKPVDYKIIDLVFLEPKFRYLEEDDKRKQRVFNPNFYEIKAIVGWAATGGGGIISGDLSNALKDTQLSLYLTLTNHQFDFQEDGAVRLTLTLTSRVESIMLDNRSDILSDPNTRRIRKERKEKVNEVLKKASKAKKAGEDACEDKDIKNLKDAYRANVERERENSYLSLLRELVKQNLIYTVVLNAQKIEEENRASPTAPVLEPAPAGVSPSDPVFSPVRTIPSITVIHPTCSEEIGSTEPIMNTLNLHNYNNLLVPGSRYINYFFLGDLFALAIQHVLDHEEGAVPLLNYGKIKFVLGPAVFDVLNLDGKLGINLADIPISVELFNAFMRDRVVSKKRNSYPLMNFIRDAIKYLIFEALAPDCTGEDKITLMLDTSQISVDSLDVTDPMLSKMEGEGFLNLDKFGTGIKVPVLNKDGYEKKTSRGLKITDEVNNYVFDSFNRKSLAESYNYFVIYVFDKGSNSLHFPDGSEFDTRYSRDFNKGIYHLATGTDRGLVKSMNFSATTQKYYREARYESRDFSPELQLSNVYDVNVSMLGNNLFFPGQRVYINPRGLGSDLLGDPGTFGDPANTIGLGGYHIIKFINSTINKSGFTTNLDCLFETSGDGIGAHPSNDDILGNETTIEGCETLREDIIDLSESLRKGGENG